MIDVDHCFMLLPDMIPVKKQCSSSNARDIMSFWEPERLT